MDSMIAYAFQLLLGLVTLTHVQSISFSVTDGYVNKMGTARLVCSVGTTINDAVSIIRNTSLAFDCPVPTVCVSQGLSSDYSATQNVSAGITVVTILNADKDRDGVEWTCRYGSLTAEYGYITLTVASPATSTKLIEEDGNITLEMTCTYPTDSLSVEFTLGDVIYSEARPIRTGFQVCTPSHEASVNYTLTFPKKHLKSYNGTFKVYVNNSLNIRMVPGSRIYTFTAEQPPSDPCAQDINLAYGLGVGLVSAFLCVIDLLVIIIVIFKCIYIGPQSGEDDKRQRNENSTHPLENPGTQNKMKRQYRHRFLLSILLGFGIIVVVCIICIVILLVTGDKCPLKLGLGLGLGLGISFVFCIIFIVILVLCKKVIIQNKDTLQSTRPDGREVKITAIIYGFWISSVEWIRGQNALTTSTNGDYTIVPYDSNERETSLTIKNFSMTKIETYICRAKGRFGCSAQYSITIPHDKKEKKTGKAVAV